MRIILGVAVIISFSICYMEWGGGNKAFLAEAEYDLLFKQKDIVQSLLHPLILSGLTGQLMVLYNAFLLFNRWWPLVTGSIILSAVPAMILLSGVLSMNSKMILSVMPFVIFNIINLRYNKKQLETGQRDFDR